ncbi:MAG TPA: MerR family DNA-binding transcriptional regulator [Coleofasciculaceae cyanobacterium]
MTDLRISKVASLIGMSVKTIRDYEQIGFLMPATKCSASGYRLFTPTVL